MAVAMEVIGAGRVAAELYAEGVLAHKRATDTAMEHAWAIQDVWMDALQQRPSSWYGTDRGYTARRTEVEPYASVREGAVGAEVYNDFFVARLLNDGTAHSSGVIDFFGLAAPHIDAFTRDVADGIDT